MWTGFIWWVDCVNVVMGIKLFYKKGIITICKIWGSHNIVTGMRHCVGWQQLPTFRRSLLLYIRCTGRPERLLLCVGKNSGIAISGFRREVDENCFLLGYYAAGCVNFAPTIRDNRSHLQGSRNKKPTLEDGTHTMSRNVGKELPLLAA
jgi:hypothetical protein